MIGIRYDLLGAQGGLRDFGPGWTGREARQVHVIHGKRVCRAEDRTDIVQTSDVVKDQPDRVTLCLTCLVRRQPSVDQFFMSKLPHMRIS